MNGQTAALDLAKMPSEVRQRQRLQTMRWLATGLLIAMIGVFLLAHAHTGEHPAWGYVAAFAEAAMVGAMADWFAVVALFRHPLGIPIWHTAIIPNSKDDIARSLGEFVESHFVTVDAIVGRIRGYDPATRLAHWLAQPANADKLGALLTSAARQILMSVDDSRIKALLRKGLTERLATLELAGPAADFGFELVAEQRHRELFDWALRASQEWLDSEGAEATIGAALDPMMDNKLLALFKGTATTRIRTGLKGLADAAAQDPQHPLRRRYDTYIAAWLLKLKTEPDIHQRLREFQLATLNGARVQSAFDGLWDELRRWLSEDLARKDPALGLHTARIAREWSASLAADTATRAWINESLIAQVIPLITDNRGKVAAFIQDEIDKWSKEEMTARLELAVGRDLQFIRINGTVVGGIVGILLYACTQITTSWR